MLLYVVRHGDPIYETDTLTERGQKQASIRFILRPWVVHS